jgi:hypothetical protein
MTEATVERDERTVAVENASYRLAYVVLTYGLLAIVAVRAVAWRESNWDLMALVLLGGGAAAAYQGAHKVFARRWWLIATIIGAVAAVLAAGAAYLISGN